MKCPICGNELSKARSNGVVPCDNFCPLRHAELNLREWEAITAALAAAERRGFEQAAKTVEQAPWNATRESVIAAIRALQPQRVTK